MPESGIVCRLVGESCPKRKCKTTMFPPLRQNGAYKAKHLLLHQMFGELRARKSAALAISGPAPRTPRRMHGTSISALATRTTTIRRIATTYAVSSEDSFNLSRLFDR